MDQYYNYCHLDKYFSDTYEKKYPLMDQYYCHPDKYFSDTYEKKYPLMDQYYSEEKVL
jgi:hypothetical protein